MSYKITSLYGLPHGHAVAVCLPEIWKYMIRHMDQIVDPRGKEYLKGVFSVIAKAMGADITEQAIGQFREMMTGLDLGRPVSNNRLRDLETLSMSVNPIRLKNNPVGLSTSVIRNLYNIIVQ